MLVGVGPVGPVGPVGNQLDEGASLITCKYVPGNGNDNNNHN